MFCDMYMPHLSGVTNHIRLTKRRLEEIGHEVFVLTFGNRDYNDTESGVIRSPAVAWGDTGWQAGFTLAEEARWIMPTLDIAHVYHPFLSGRVALRYAGAKGVPVVSTTHTRYDLYSDAYAKFVPRRLRMGFIRSYLNRYASEVDLVIAPSPGIVDWLSEFGITDEALLLPNGIDSKMFGEPASPISRTELGFAEDSTVFCYLGRLGPEKNLSLLMDAFVETASVNVRTCLLLIGDGPGRGMATERAWANKISDRVYFAGRTPYEHVPDLLAAADVFVSASVTEVHPLVVMEAMAAGLPAIGVNSPGVRDIIEHGQTGYLTAEDCDELATRMLELARERPLLEKLAGAAREAAGGHDISIAVDLLVTEYERLAAASNRG